jgi:hypothetical protein
MMRGLGKGQQIRKRILSELSTLFESGSTLYLDVSVPMSKMTSICEAYAVLFDVPAS